MKTKQTLTVLLVLSVSVNLFIYLTAFHPGGEIKGYAPAATVSEETANNEERGFGLGSYLSDR